ncbi:hypothetical protein [Palleronia abyssalis]|uniref:Lipoprotein n=1 Tax=Palleronia abyssalis TaxID=1501240 RepID=A0A2R8BTV7_9RHOB|nr:hypothetical protein [Palleronia abyssalis]SPJ23570.1 hypothetical protein PAA8504_01382 [Palleronia abyssalis]
MPDFKVAFHYLVQGRKIAFCALALLTAACGQINSGRVGGPSDGIAETPYTMVETGRAWLYVPTGLVTLERDLGGVREQRVALPNDTTVPGDNFILMRTRASAGLGGNRLKLEPFLHAAGGLAAPFTDVSAGQFQGDEDALGPYFYVNRTAGPNVSCVLAVRPIDGAASLLPRGASAVDVLMRNCVTGDASAALAPIEAQALGRSVGRGADAGQVALRNMSPFAAPEGASR